MKMDLRLLIILSIYIICNGAPAVDGSTSPEVRTSDAEYIKKLLEDALKEKLEEIKQENIRRELIHKHNLGKSAGSPRIMRRSTNTLTEQLYNTNQYVDEEEPSNGYSVGGNNYGTGAYGNSYGTKFHPQTFTSAQAGSVYYPQAVATAQAGYGYRPQTGQTYYVPTSGYLPGDSVHVTRKNANGGEVSVGYNIRRNNNGIGVSSYSYGY
ncbi:hypothetical protein PV327_006538 [Microctonus hyperodae]|uniref:Uncharacterized protein n=1 Tax=Microctonus hyperodae TaxID=165561 RepID=A0AA39KIJ4_MICHY|nr:hypothetical protein PV327_006538 [Microctonus hyperodae]